MWRIGLTGGIGSGKSTVLATLASLGAATIDADAISRATTAAGGAAMPAIAREFGPGFVGPDGAMDRDRMRAEVFARPAARQQLEAIIHPLVGAAIGEWIAHRDEQRAMRVGIATWVGLLLGLPVGRQNLLFQVLQLLALAGRLRRPWPAGRCARACWPIPAWWTSARRPSHSWPWPAP